MIAFELLGFFAIEADAPKGFVDFVQRFFAKVGDAQQVIASAMEQVFHCENASFL
jgi:hypothetical protein